MRMQKVNGGSQRKSAGEISDGRLQQPRDEREAVQKRTFTRWMNVFLQRRDPPVEVHDLFTDIQDGRVLMALLEELSGCKLLYRFRSSSHRIFRLNNISKALAFLDDRHVKLLGIDASGVADGIPSVVLNLIWNMILYFQVKEVTGGLQRHLSSSLSSLSMSSYPSSSDLSPQPNDIGNYSCSTLPSKGRKAARESKYHGKAIKTLLQWVQRCTSKFGVEVHDFGKSWRSGLAFLALIKSINPALVDLRDSLFREPRENIQQAFMIAHHSLDISPLLEPDDVSGTSPDEQSIITYVSMFLGHCSVTDEDHTTDIEVPEIPNFGSLESISFGEIVADDPQARALVQSLEKSSEQTLWKRWARRSPGSPQTTSPFNKKKSRCRGSFQPPSPLDAGVVSQEIRSWMEKADQGYSNPRVDESHLSLSSEEGIYTLPPLDPDEEDAYSYILDLNKEVFQPYNRLKRQVPRVEEETEEEMFLNRQQTEETKYLEVCKTTLNGSGWKHREGPDDESKVRAQSGVQRTSENEGRSREMVSSTAVFEPEVDSRSREEHGDERGVNGDDSDYCEEEKKERAENGCDEGETLVDEAKNTKLSEVASWKTEVEEKEIKKCGQVSEKRVVDEKENEMTFEEGQDRKSEKGKEEEDKEEERKNQQSAENLESFKVNERMFTDNDVRGVDATGVNTKEGNDRKYNTPKTGHLTCKDEDKEESSDEVMNSVDSEEKDQEFKIKGHELTDRKATINHPGVSAPKNDTNGGVDIHSGDRWTPACAATSQSLREGGFILQSSAVSCDITPLELELLLVLWILLYCCFLLPQMNL